LRLIGARDGRDGALTIHRDVDLYSALLAAGESVTHATTPDRKVWVQVVRGQVTVNGDAAKAGDGIALEGADQVVIGATSGAEVLLFDMA